jgi:N utilization substance protein B
MGKRRRAREAALQILYFLDSQEQPVERLLTTYFTYFRDEAEGAPLDEESRTFTEELVRGVVGRRDAIDQLITRAALNWRLERMARVDRNVLRIATYELTSIANIPARVTLNEAIELAKRYGTSESAAFVNGILDKVAQSTKAASNEGR